MKKTVYLLGLTLLCGFQAQAQEMQSPEYSVPVASGTTEVIAEQTASASAPHIEEEQTIFFSDELLNEIDEELKAPLFTDNDKENQPTAPHVPTVKIPEGVKTPDVNTVSAPQAEPSETEAFQPEKENGTATPENKLQKEPVEKTIPQKIEENSGTNLPEQEKTTVSAEAVEVLNEQSEQPASPAPAKTANVQNAPQAAAEAPEIQNIQTENQETPPVAETAEVSNTAPEQAETLVYQEKTALKKNAFSLDENALLQQQNKASSYSLDSSALSGNFLKGDALSPSVLNRSIVNISPEQRAKMMMKKKYGEMDANQDGMVSENEFVEYKTQEARKIAHQVFKQIDRNDDKMLSQYEYGLLMDKMIENYIKQPQKK